MRYVVLAVGRMRPPYADDAAHYLKLLGGHARVEIVEVRDEAALHRRVPERAHVCALEATGEGRTSEGFAAWVRERRLESRDVAFVLGGAFGFGETGLPRVDSRLSLGPMTLPHLLARVVLLEQLFRAHKILAGEPYHH